jgi:hypothetical protein
MRSSNRPFVIALASLVVAIAVSGAVAQQPVVVSVPTFRAGLACAAGWGPAVERTAQGFRAVFSKPGTYRGAFTIAAGHRSNDVYPLIVTVTER